MLEKTGSWLEREAALGAALEGKSLIGQVNVSAEDLELLGRELGSELRKRETGRAEPFLKSNAALSTAVFLVWCGIKRYRAGNFWGGALRLLGIQNVSTGEKNKARKILGEVFRYALEKHGLEGFSRLAESGHRYVTPILAHGGIPDYCLDDFIEHLIIPLALGRFEVDPDDLDEIIDEFLGKSSATFTDKPVRNFLRYGGNISRDLVCRCVKTASRYIEGKPAPARENLHLPTAVSEAVRDHVKGKSFERKRERRRLTVRPRICLSPHEGAIVLHVPEAEIPAGNVGGAGGDGFLYIVSSVSRELHTWQAGIEQHLRNAVLLKSHTVNLPGPFESLTVTLLELKTQREIFRRQLDFLPVPSGISPGANLAVTYLVFSEEDLEGYCRFTVDTIRASSCWLVKRRSARILGELRELEEVSLHGSGWKGFHAVNLQHSEKDFLTLSDQASGDLTRIPVRVDLRGQVKARENGLLPNVTWSGKPVYTRPPILDLPPLRDPDRFVLELEDDEGRTLLESSLEKAVEHEEDGLVLNLGKLEPPIEWDWDVFRCSISGKLGEREDLEFACVPGLRVEFGDEGRYPDGDGRSSRMEIRISCNGAEEAKVEEALKSRFELDDSGGLRGFVPSHLTKFFFILRLREKDVSLRVRVPRFAFRFEDGGRKDSGEGALPSEPAVVEVEERTALATSERLRGLEHTSLLETRLEDLASISLLEISLPRPCGAVELYLESLDTSSTLKKKARNLRFALGKFLSAMESHGAGSFRLRLRIEEEDGASADFPIMAVRKGWAPRHLTRKITGDEIRLRWEEDGGRTRAAEVILKNLFRPWEEPSTVRVEAGEGSCVVPIPGGSGARGRFALCFRLLDEWEWQEPRLPFQLPSDAYKVHFHVDKNPAMPGTGSDRIYLELEKATEYLFDDYPAGPSVRRPPTFNGINDGTDAAEIRAAMLTYLYWVTECAGRNRKVEDRLCEAIRSWATAGEQEEAVDNMLDELEDVGGGTVAAAVESLRLRLYPEKVEPPFLPGARLRYKKDGRLYEYLGTQTIKSLGERKTIMRFAECEGDSGGKGGRAAGYKRCLPCHLLLPPDKHVEFEYG